MQPIPQMISKVQGDESMPVSAQNAAAMKNPMRMVQVQVSPGQSAHSVEPDQ